MATVELRFWRPACPEHGWFKMYFDPIGRLWFCHHRTRPKGRVCGHVARFTPQRRKALTWVDLSF